MLHTVRYALDIYRKRDRIDSLRRRAMKQDLSFQKSALEYAKLYIETAGYNSCDFH